MEEAEAKALIDAISVYKYEETKQEKFTEQKDCVNLELFLEDIRPSSKHGSNRLLYRSGAAIVIEYLKTNNSALYNEKREVYNSTSEGQRSPLPGLKELDELQGRIQVSNKVDFLLITHAGKIYPWFTNEQLHALAHFARKTLKKGLVRHLRDFIIARAYTDFKAVMKALLVNRPKKKWCTVAEYHENYPRRRNLEEVEVEPQQKQQNSQAATAASRNSNKPSVVSDVEYLPNSYWTSNLMEEVEVEPQQQKNSQPATAASRKSVATSTSSNGISDIVAPEKTLRLFIDSYKQRIPVQDEKEGIFHPPTHPPPESYTFLRYLDCCLNMPFVDKCLLVNDNDTVINHNGITHNGNLRTRKDIIFLWSLLPESSSSDHPGTSRVVAMTRANSTVDGDPSNSITNNNTSVSSRGAVKGQSKALSPFDSNVPQKRGGRGVAQCSTNHGSRSSGLSPIDSNVPQERGGGGVTQCSTNYGSSSSGGTDEGKNCSSKTPSQEEDEETGAVTESLNHRAAGVVPVTGANSSNSKANNVNSASKKVEQGDGGQSKAVNPIPKGGGGRADVEPRSKNGPRGGTSEGANCSYTTPTQDDKEMEVVIIYSSDEDIDATSSKPTNPTCRKKQGSRALPGKKNLEQDVPGKLGAASLLASRKVVGGDSDDGECAAGANVKRSSRTKNDQERVEAFAQPSRKRKSLDPAVEQGRKGRPPKSQTVGAATPVSRSTPCVIAMAKESEEHPEHQQRKPSALSPSTATATEMPDPDTPAPEWELLLQKRSNKLSMEDRSRVKHFFEDGFNPTPQQSIYKTKLHQDRTTDPQSGRAMKETYYMELNYETCTLKQFKKVKYY